MVSKGIAQGNAAMVRKRGDSTAVNSSKTRINAGVIWRLDEAKNSEGKEKQVTIRTSRLEENVNGSY